ncbi:MAG: OmpP1/FadL family transporter, partial [Gammaproteobacteria bacterium]
MRVITQMPHKVCYYVIIILVFAISPSIFAAGFQISEQSGTGMGRAFAGFGVINDDLSNAFYNPAGLTLKKGMQIQVSGYLIDGKSRFDADEAQSGTNPAIFPLGENEDGATFAVVPNLYFTMDLTDRLKYGFSISSPFGLATDYDRNWVGRFQAKESELITININPSLAYKVSDSFSIGAGLVAEHAEATLSRVVVGGPGVEGFAEAKGEDWGYGWNIGFMYHPNPTFRAGVGYRSKIGHELDGDDNDITGTPLGGGDFSADVVARATLPETIHAGLYKEFSNKWGLSLGLRWTRWNRLQEIVVVTDSPFVPDSVLELNWDNTYSANIGIDYYHSDKWTFRAGYMFDESPTNDR